MAMQETLVKKLQQATCDKPDLNRRILKLQKAFKEVEKTLSGADQPRKKK